MENEVIKAKIRKELIEIDREYKIYRYSYHTLMISLLFMFVINIAFWFDAMSFYEWYALFCALTFCILFSGVNFLRYYNRTHKQNPEDW